MFLTTKLGKEKLDHLAYTWFNTTCFHTQLWCEDGEPLLVCPENVLIELTENVHIVLFLIMLLFLIEAVMVIRAGKAKMRQWYEHEEFCLSNSLGVAAARVKLSADHFERADWWSCGMYDGRKGRWMCGCYPRNKVKRTVEGDGHSRQSSTSIYDMRAPMNGNTRRQGSAVANVANDKGSPSSVAEEHDIVWDALTTARHFGKLPEKRQCMCPCIHARNEYFESRSQLRYCTMRTGFINAHNKRMNSNGEETKLPTSFDFAEYVSHILGEHLAEMVDVSPFNWLTLWAAFLVFMIFDFMDLWEEKDGWLLTLVAVATAYLSCIVLFIIRNDTIHIEHALLNDAFMSFHVSHGICGRLMCSCCFNANKIRVAHHEAIRKNLYEMGTQYVDPTRERERAQKIEHSRKSMKLHARVRRQSMMAAAADAAMFAAKLRLGSSKKLTNEELDGHTRRELEQSLLPKTRKKVAFGAETKRGLGSLVSIGEEEEDANSDENVMSALGGGSSRKPSRRLSLKSHAHHLMKQHTAPSVEVDPIKLHRFDTHMLDYDHENHHPRYRWIWDAELNQWSEVPLVRSSAFSHCCHHCTGDRELLNHHQRLFCFGKFHRHFLFNYVRMSLLMLAVYMGVFCIQFGQSVLAHFNPREGEEEKEYHELLIPVMFFIFAIIPVIIHDTMLPDIVAKIVQTTKTEQMIDTKHVQRVLGMMKAKNALMVLHNMSSFMHHIDEEAHQARLAAKLVLANMPGLEMLSEKEMTTLVDRCAPQTFAKGASIIVANELSSSMYIIISGQVGRSLASDPHGYTNIIGGGSFFGSKAMITGERTDYNAYAMTSKVLLFELSHDDAKEHLPDNTWKNLQTKAQADLVAEKGSSLRTRKQSVHTLLRSSSITPPPNKRKTRHRHLKSALQMLRELAMHSTFTSIDTDCGGTISTDELKTFFAHLFPLNHPNHLFHVDQINILGKDLDLNGNGEISEKEFHDYMMPIIVREDTMGDPEDSARRMFNILDEQGGQGSDGKVTTKKFKDLLNLFGMNMSYEEVRELFHEYDEDFDGYLDEEEFARMMIESGVEG